MTSRATPGLSFAHEAVPSEFWSRLGSRRWTLLRSKNGSLSFANRFRYRSTSKSSSSGEKKNRLQSSASLAASLNTNPRVMSHTVSQPRLWTNRDVIGPFPDGGTLHISTRPPILSASPSITFIATRPLRGSLRGWEKKKKKASSGGCAGAQCSAAQSRDLPETVGHDHRLLLLVAEHAFHPQEPHHVYRVLFYARSFDLSAERVGRLGCPPKGDGVALVASGGEEPHPVLSKAPRAVERPVDEHDRARPHSDGAFRPGMKDFHLEPVLEA
mmetsp:Transcript_6609/g.16098  ORF Transcript_6609/g.16098 Transcript_6609/m.16098 type:complete len:271 (-) Transcript_6609:406-1218(-)